MSPLYVYTIFNDDDKPRLTSIKDGDRIINIDLFKGKGNGSGRTIKDILTKIDKIKKILDIAENTREIVLSDYKRHIKAFNLEIPYKKVNVYDMHLPAIKPSSDLNNISLIVDKMSKRKKLEYQHILANAHIVYQDLEKHGININYIKYHPKWSTETFSGRSKTTNPNLQGWHEDSIIRNDNCNENDILIHFDWICADIRIASILSDDKLLQQSFIDGDPYQLMADMLSQMTNDTIDRNNCKLYLLKSINSMDHGSIPLNNIYKDLGQWILRCKSTMQNQNNTLETILGRKFKVINSKNELAVLNGVMQGSVAHAMQCVIRNVWEKLPKKLIAEIHDSIVICCPSKTTEINSTISIISDIMTRPFNGILDDNPFFPIKISVGKKWKKWKHFLTVRENGKTYAK